MFGYRVPAPDQAMLISGGRHKAGVPFRVVIGRGAFIIPFFRKVRFLTLAMQETVVNEPCTSTQGINVAVKAVIAFKVGNDEESIVNAGQRFLSDQSKMPDLTGQIFAGHLRSIVGGMTIEDIITQRQKLATEVLDGSKIEMGKIGLIVDSLQIQSIDDQRSGYIDAMGAPHRAAIAQRAQTAQAQADQATKIAQAAAAQAAAEAEQESVRAQAQFARDTAIKQAELKAEVDQAQAKAAQAGPLAQAQAQLAVVAAQAELQQQQSSTQMDVATAQAALAQRQAKSQVEVTEAQGELAKKQADLREQQLQAEVLKPAQAEAQKIEILAKANAQRVTLEAEAMAAGSRVTLDQQIIDQWPAVMKEVAGGIQGSQLTILNGADGLAEFAASLVSQGATVLNLLRGSMNGNGHEAASAGKEVAK